MATKQIIIPDIGPVTLYKRRGNRSLRLSVGLDGEVRVSLPYWVPYRAAEEFARKRVEWIVAHQNQGDVILQDGQLIGKAHRLRFEPTSSSRISSRTSLTEIRVHHPITTNTDHHSVQSKARAAGIRALRQEAEQLLPGRLRELASSHGFEFKSVAIKQFKGRWGSCSSHRDIALNLFLMQLPWHLIDYVLLHELTHTKVMQHGQPFWSELEKHLPNAKQLKQEINTYQPTLIPQPSVA